MQPAAKQKKRRPGIGETGLRSRKAGTRRPRGAPVVRRKLPARAASRTPTAKPGETRRAPRFAKISAPQLRNVYPRERIFSLLDQASGHRAIWISAPAGFGKTTAVASWLRASGASTLWYNCDSGDADAASFFYFLTLALRSSRGATAGSMPRPAAELQTALPTFARNFMRSFCARLRRPTMLVLDNLQDIPRDAPLRMLLPIMISECTGNLTPVLLSREEPDPGLARLRSTGELQTIGWPELQLSLEETCALADQFARSQVKSVGIAADELHALTQGWAAGVAMLLRAGARSGRFISNVPSQETFDYLAAEVFGRLDDSTRAFLLDTAVLEGFTRQVAAAVSRNPGALEVLERLVRRNVFIQLRADSGTYHYHSLFQGFLRSEALRQRTDAERAALHARAARCLVQAGELEHAAPHFLQASERAEAGQVVLQLMPALIEQGRFRTALDQIASVSGPDSPARAWLLYWEGIARMAVDFPRSRSALEAAYRHFGLDRDSTGQLLTAATILQQVLMEFDDYRRMLPWIDAIEGLLDGEVRFPTTAVELSVLAGVLAATAFARPQRTRIDWCRDRIESLLRTERDPLSRAAAASVFMNYCAMSGQLARMRAIAVPQPPPMDQAHASPAALAHMMWMQGFLEFISGNVAQCHALLAGAIELVRHHGLPGFEARCQIARLQSLDFETHADEIGATLNRLEPNISNEPAFVRANFCYMRGVFRLAQRQLDAAAVDLTQADDIARVHGYVLVRALIGVDLGVLMSERGDISAAREHLQRSQGLIGDLNFPIMDFHRLLLAADIARRSGAREEFLGALRAGFAIGREQGFAACMHGCNLMLRALLPHALEHGIETTYCRWLIRLRNWTPPSQKTVNWPWPIRIRTLGVFEIELENELLRLRGKQQRRPLALLTALAASPKGLTRAVLAAQLWPRLDGAPARGALDMAILRLRKLLNRQDAVLVESGRVRLNRAIAAVDVQDFDDFVAQTPPSRGTSDDLSARARRLCTLYPGRFMLDDASPEIERTRDRLHQLFLRHVLALGLRLRDLHAWRDLESLYEHAAELEPLSDEIHTRLMEALIAQEKIGSARSLYSRYRLRLSRGSGARPSLALQRLAQMLQ